jgi:TonB family protein
MRKRLWFVLCGLVMLAGVVQGQSDKDIQKSFEKSIEHETLFLRNQSLDSVISGHWTGTGVVFDPSGSSLSVVKINSVKVKGNAIEIGGHRALIEPKRGAPWATGSFEEKIKIAIDLKGAEPSAVFPVLRDSLFTGKYINAQNAEGPPTLSARSMNNDLTGAGSAYVTNVEHCDCSDYGTPACKGRHAVDGGTPPKILRMLEPEFSEEARKAKLNGNVVLSLVVGETGRAEHIRVLRGLGLGLDEKAVMAVGGYVFRPATCHDQPAKVQLNVEVNFQIF